MFQSRENRVHVQSIEDQLDELIKKYVLSVTNLHKCNCQYDVKDFFAEYIMMENSVTYAFQKKNVLFLGGISVNFWQVFQQLSIYATNQEMNVFLLHSTITTNVQDVLIQKIITNLDYSSDLNNAYMSYRCDMSGKLRASLLGTGLINYLNKLELFTLKTILRSKEHSAQYKYLIDQVNFELFFHRVDILELTGNIGSVIYSGNTSKSYKSVKRKK